jgi:hypothetical protein
MTRGTLRSLLRPRSLAVGLAALAGLGLSSCGGGGGGGGGGGPMTLVEFLFVDETLTPSFPTGTQALPRNARIVFGFSGAVDPSSINEQTIQIRKEPVFQTVPLGSFQVDGNRVIFDPTITKAGQPNPVGFDAFTQYNVFLPSVTDRESDPETAVVESAGDDPLLTSFFTKFKTSGGFLRELTPPTVVECFFVPTPDPLTKQIPGNGIMALRFSEAMDPATFLLATNIPTPEPNDTIDIRYDCTEPTNAGVECRPIAMNNPTHNPAMDTFFFEPVFSFGTKKYKFFVQVMQGLSDLAGNLLVNPRSFGPFVVDGTGREEGDLLVESFTSQTDNDPGATTADWSITTQGVLQGAAISSRRTFITGWQQTERVRPTYTGQYFALVDPLVGADLNQFVANIQPPTAAGRRVMWSFKDLEMGQNGSVTTASWGPDSNATFAAKYPNIIMQIGFQKTASMNLAATFPSNYLGSPLTMYQGEYNVTQSANVGNETGAEPVDAAGNPATPPSAQLAPLYNYWGYTNWPAPTSYFDWNEGDPAIEGDRVLVLDIQAMEGDSWNQFRGWFAFQTPTAGGLLIPGEPQRRMLATYDEDTPNPQPNVPLGILNPEPTVQDTAFTITKRVSVGQSRFYTPGPVDDQGNTYPGPYSTQRTRGVESNYLPPILQPPVQPGGATILVEFQGAMSLEEGSARTRINLAQPSTPWTTDIDDVDEFPYIRWRITLTSNLNSNTVGRVESIAVPVLAID